MTATLSSCLYDSVISRLTRGESAVVVPGGEGDEDHGRAEDERDMLAEGGDVALRAYKLCSWVKKSGPARLVFHSRGR